MAESLKTLKRELGKFDYMHEGREEAIANFLFNNVGKFGKEAVGEILGDEKYKDVLPKFFSNFDFKNKDFIPALREALNQFRLPGEAQKIDRIVEAFAKEFYDKNPGKVASSDAAYTLAFSVIMLNTDLHSPKIKSKMTQEQFIRNNRGMNGGKDFNENMLKAIYNEIKKNEIKMNDSKVAPTRSQAVTTQFAATSQNSKPAWGKGQRKSQEYSFENESEKKEKLGRHRPKSV